MIMTQYIDDMGKTVKVSSGISHSPRLSWMSCRVKKSGSLQRVKSKSLPIRDTKEEAQADLNRYASQMRWSIVPPYPGWEDEN